MSLGSFDDRISAENLMKYIQCKFVRALLGVLKVTHHITVDSWKYVPIQDFSVKSEIDWNQSVHDIDLQLYNKYELTEEEIRFIETNVKEMV